MTFTQDQLLKFVRYHQAAAASPDGQPTLNQEFAASISLRREELAFVVSNRVALEAAARSAGLL